MSVKFTSYKDEVIAATDQAIRRALHICGDVAQGHAFDYCPKRTGTLARSIVHNPIDNNTEMIGTAVEYAPYVELGTIKMTAKPYLRPAVERHRNEYRQIIETELNE